MIVILLFYILFVVFVLPFVYCLTLPKGGQTPTKQTLINKCRVVKLEGDT